MNALVARLGGWLTRTNPSREAAILESRPGLLSRVTRRRIASAGMTALYFGCASPEPLPVPPAPRTIADTKPTEQLPIDGIWRTEGSAGELVQIDRGRMYVQAGFGTERRHGDLLYTDIHQSGPASYRCRAPSRAEGRTTLRACTLHLEEGALIASVKAEARVAPARFHAVALADDIWFEAQVNAWHMLSLREAHRPEPEITAIPIAPLPDLPPSPPTQEPLLPPASVRSPYGAYHALVVGAGDYLYLPEVATARGDADAVSSLLQERYEFDVTDLRDPTLAELSRAIEHYADRLGEDDNLLLYFAGHGMMSEELGRCYWFARDATGDDVSEGLGNDDLAAKLRDLKALRVLVVADSCFTASVARAIELAEPEGGALAPPKLRTRVVLTSGGLEPIQSGSGGAHSVFTGALLQALSANDDRIDGTALSAEILEIVTAGASQTPEYGDIRGANHEGGDFVFVVVPGPAQGVEQASERDRQAGEGLPGAAGQPTGEAPLE